MNKVNVSLKTKRLTLKMLNVSDVNLTYVSWLNDKSVNQYLESRFTEQTLETCQKFVHDCNADPFSYLFGVFDRHTLIHIGNCKIGFIDPHHHKAQIGLMIGEKDYWSKGLGHEIVSTLTQFGFSKLKLKRLEAYCYQDNLASLKVFLDCGYHVEGFLKNSIDLNGKRTGQFILGLTQTIY